MKALVVVAMLMFAACGSPFSPFASYEQTVTLCTTTAALGAPTICQPVKCLVTPQAGGARRYDCGEHHFIREPDGSTHWA